MKLIYETTERKRIVIVGAGISGCMLALHLAKKGFEVEVFEKRKFDLDNTNRSRICISDKELLYLSKLGLYEQLKSIFYPIQGFKETVIAAHTKFSALNKFPLYIGDKEELCKNLITECINSGKVKFYFNHTLEIVNLQEKLLTFTTDDSTILTIDYHYLFGCDGKQSLVREEMKSQGFIDVQNSDITFHLKHLYVSIKDIILEIDPNFIHTWTYKNDLLVVLPDKLRGFEFYIYTHEQDFSYNELGILKPLNSIINKKTLLHELTHTPTYSINEVIDTSTIQLNDVLLWGDAAKTITTYQDLNIDKCVEGIRKFSSLLIQTELNLEKEIVSFAKLERDNSYSSSRKNKKVYQ